MNQWKQSKGLVIIYVGDGKGKTTAAVGAAVRALGHGWNILFMQFMKEEQWPSGEREFFRSLVHAGSAVSPTGRHASASGKTAGLRGGGPSENAVQQLPQPSYRAPLASDLADLPSTRPLSSPGERTADPAIASLGTMHVEVVGEGFVGIMNDRKPRETHKNAAQAGYEKAVAALRAGEYQFVILDEILSAVDERLLTEQQILDLIEKKPQDVTLIMTGHKQYPAIFAKADCVTEMRKIKHPFDAGFIAKKGVDY